jgi:hypothetical protein
MLKLERLKTTLLSRDETSDLLPGSNPTIVIYLQRQSCKN